MADQTTIEWTDATWNPVTGCAKVSPGCDRCYAETFAERWRGIPGHHFEQGFDVRMWPDRLDVPLRWRKPRRIFVNSMSDLFHDAVPEEFIAAVMAIMAAAEWHTFQILTKRHARMRALFTTAGFIDQVRDHADYAGWYDARDRPWPLANVWLGVSAETQQWADIRVPALLDTPAAVRFVSAEPLLGPIDLTAAVRTMGSQRGHGQTAAWVHAGDCCHRFHGIDWVIAGGESGPGARPMHPAWARGLRDQCATAGVPFFFKQWGEWAPTGQRRTGDATGREYLADQADAHGFREVMRRVGKKHAGRVLDGRTHDAYPAGGAR